MAKYAKTTTVPAIKSKQEIESTLIRYGASSFFSAWDGDRAQIGFRLADRFIKLELKIPADATNRDQKERQLWRILLLVTKAKLEAVDSGISTIEAEFLANIVTTDGRTVGEHLNPQIETMYKTGQWSPRLLGGGS